MAKKGGRLKGKEEEELQKAKLNMENLKKSFNQLNFRYFLYNSSEELPQKWSKG